MGFGHFYQFVHSARMLREGENRGFLYIEIRILFDDISQEFGGPFHCSLSQPENGFLSDIFIFSFSGQSDQCIVGFDNIFNQILP